MVESIVKSEEGRAKDKTLDEAVLALQSGMAMAYRNDYALLTAERQKGILEGLTYSIEIINNTHKTAYETNIAPIYDALREHLPRAPPKRKKIRF